MPNIEKDFSYVDEWKSMWKPDLEAIVYNGATCDPTKVHPNVLQWAKENCAHKPKFIKVINKTASRYGWRRPRGPNSHAQFQLGVPRPFLREHYRELGRVVTLENGVSCKKWKVSFGAPRKSSSWLQGWRRVADDNGLNPGDVMVFVLVGHSHFRFHLFDEDGNLPGILSPGPRHCTATVKPEPNCDAFHQERRVLTEDSEDELFQHKKLRRLFDPDLAIVKLEPGLFQRSPSPERNEPTLELPAHESPDSELTVTDGDQETIARGEVVSEGKNSPNTRLCLITSPEIAVKDVSAAHCTKTASRQSDGGCEDGTVKRKLELESTKNMKPVEDVISQQITSLQVQPQGTHELPINPLSYFVESKRRKTTPAERKRARDMAKSYAVSLNGSDSFVLVMTGALVYSDFHLGLPEQFVLESGFPAVKTKFRLVDWDGSKSWDMFSMKNSCNEVAFHRKYWGVFSLEHFLEEGDVCVFQLVDKNTFTVSVRIFRVLQLPKHLGTVRDHYELRPNSPSHK